MKRIPYDAWLVLTFFLIMLLFMSLLIWRASLSAQPHTFRLTYASGEVQEITGTCSVDPRIGKPLIFECQSDPWSLNGGTQFFAQPVKVEVIR